MTNIYPATRKIHRIFVLIIIVLGLIMTFTGLLLKYNFLPTDLVMMRYIHNNLSGVFGIVLLVMIGTGTYMYIYPWYMKRKMQKEEQPKN